jgi:hypothetical protein
MHLQKTGEAWSISSSALHSGRERQTAGIRQTRRWPQTVLRAATVRRALLARGIQGKTLMLVRGMKPGFPVSPAIE